METHKFNGVTINVKRKDGAAECTCPEVVEVVEDYKGSAEQKWLLLKKSNGAALVTAAMMLSEKVDSWCHGSRPGRNIAALELEGCPEISLRAKIDRAREGV